MEGSYIYVIQYGKNRSPSTYQKRCITTYSRMVRRGIVRADRSCRALVFWIRWPCRKMKRIIASPRLCTLLDISVHRPLDSDILMPKGSATDLDMYRRYLRLYMHAHVYTRAAFEHRIYIADHSAHVFSSSKTSLLTPRIIIMKLARVISE